MSVKNYYAGSNSSVGFYSLFREIFTGLNHLFILKGGPGTGKSTFMRKIGLVFMEKNYDLEYYHCSLDNQSLDGLIVPSLKLGFVKGVYPHLVDPVYPGAVESVIDFGQFLNDEFLQQHRDAIIKLTDEMKENLAFAHRSFKEGEQIHWKKEEIYLTAMNFAKANLVIEQLMEEIFSVPVEKEVNQICKKRFFGASTPKGAVNFIDNITEDINTRYIIKGRPGSGKSTIMKKIAAKAVAKGLSVEYFPCALDPKSLDMIIIPTLSIAIVDGTAPHVVNPFRKNDKVIDMFEKCIDPNVESIHKGTLFKLNTDYQTKMAHGTNYLSEAKRLHDKLEEYYVKAMDFTAVDHKRNEVIATLFN